MDEMIDLTPFIKTAIFLLCCILMRYVVPWLKANTTAKEREDLLTWARIAVYAAQQLFYQEDGTVRLKYALELMEAKGFDINDSAVLDAVEAAVLKLHNSLKEKNDIGPGDERCVDSE